MAKRSVVEAREITKRFVHRDGEFTALERVSLDVHEVTVVR